MKNIYKVRIHTGRMETKYGVDITKLIDDPDDPNYTEDEVIAVLKDKLYYEDAKDEDAEYPGYYDGEVGAYFDYDGYIDVKIPDTIVSRILKGVGTNE